MNKQSLYLFGGALMATTALSTASQAAVIKADALTSTGTTAITPLGLAIEVFSRTAATAATAVIGSAAGTASNLLIDFAASFTSAYNINVFVSGANFTGTPTVLIYSQTSTGSLTASTTGGCSVQALPDKLLITNCSATGSGTGSRADAMRITGITYVGAGALGIAGSSIKIEGYISNATGNLTFENITSAAVVTSKSAAETKIETGATVSIDSLATPLFSKFTTSGTQATLGTIHFSSTAAVGSDLSTTFGTAASISGNVEVKVTHPALTDLPGLLSVSLVTTTTTSRSPGQFVSGTVSFTIAPGSLNGAVVQLTFDGTSPIATAAGTSTVTVTPTTTTGGIARAVAAFSGALATYNRGGLSVEVNSLFNTAGVGSTLYRSLLRVANTSPIDGVATITVKNDLTGAAIGSYTATITAGATKQISSADIEAAISTALAVGAPYKVVVSGGFNGYVQHLLWNSVTGLFTDLSGFRNGALTIDP